ncbi:PR domain zinc finger protein 4 [Folsomia candida]|uniref:PR domain zinc finger protein 4 n=1 Tax=Folsomia candida TaxID=158441 RepID=A0A226DCM2_FOLCA|nr:PR domain zinc finger protein 4 [Folsomia candida]
MNRTGLLIAPLCDAIQLGRSYQSSHRARAERPFKCDVCQARFLVRSDLMRHAKNHPPRSALRLTCPQCPVLFAKPNELRKHLTVDHAVPKESATERRRKYREGAKNLAVSKETLWTPAPPFDF